MQYATSDPNLLLLLAESVGKVSVAASPIKLQTLIKNLGVYLDSKMSFDKQVSETCKACFFHIRVLNYSIFRVYKWILDELFVVCATAVGDCVIWELSILIACFYLLACLGTKV